MKYIVILNAEAGLVKKGAPLTDPHDLGAAFMRAGIEAEIHKVAPKEMEPVLHEALARTPDAVIVGGGDGTIRCAASVLAETGVPLGVLPLGTLNHFAKDLGLPTKLEEAVAALAAGIVRQVDLGEVNGQVFINNCSLGAYAEAVRRREALTDDSPRALGKWRAMIRAAWTTFRRLRLLRLEVTLGSKRPELLRTPLLVVGNNRYTGHLLSQCLRPRLDEGRLWLYSVNAHRHLTVLRLILRALVRPLDDTDALSSESSDTLTVQGLNGRIPVAADGEVMDLKSPLHFKVRAGALRVLAPVPVPSRS